MTAPTIPSVPGIVGPDSIGDKRPNINRMGVGRTIAIKPLRVEQVTKPDGPNKTKIVRRVIADVIVLDGPPIMFGGNQNSGIPDNMSQAVPCIVTQLWIDETVVGNQIERYSGSGSYVVGRIKQLPARDGGRPAWAIEDTTPADNALFLGWWNATAGGMNFHNPAPVDLAPPQGLSGGVVAAQYVPQPQAAPAHIPAQYVPQAVPAPVPQAAPAFDMAAFQAAQAAMRAPEDLPPANSGIDAGVWATLPEAQKNEVYAVMGLTRQGAPVPSAPPGF